MQDLEIFVSMLIGFMVLGVFIAITVGICVLVNFIRNKRHKKWCTWMFDNYPELKVLLSEYHRLRTEYSDTTRTACNLLKVIDEWVERNKYLPEGCRVDKHIENLKEQYQELLDIRAEQGELVDQAKEDLVNFWETNFPNLPEHKRLMWWSE